MAEPGAGVASAGFELLYLESAQISWADVERGRGPTGTAIRERRTVAAQNFLTDPTLAPWRAAAVERGYGSAIAMPLFGEAGHCLGAISLYAGGSFYLFGRAALRLGQTRR